MNPQPPGYGPPPYGYPSPAQPYQTPAHQAYPNPGLGQPAPAGAWSGGCPRCGSPNVTQPSFTIWGGVIGGKLMNHHVCGQCRYGFNGRTGHGNGPGIAIYVVTTLVLASWALSIATDGPRSVAALFLRLPIYFMLSVAVLGASIVVKSKRPDAFAPLLAAGLLELATAAADWAVTAVFTFERSPDFIAVADVIHHAATFANIFSTALIAIALVRLARPPIFVRGPS